MLMHYNKTSVAVVTLLGIMASLGWFAAVQAGGGGERRLPTCFPVVGRLSEGGTFIGELVSPNLAVDEGQLHASGVLVGKATVNGITQTIWQPFTDIGVELRQVGQSNVCDVVILDFDPIRVDQLNLDVDLSRITLNSTAPRTCGSLLGQLLCPLAGLLNHSSPNWTVIQQLINVLNELP